MKLKNCLSLLSGLSRRRDRRTSNETMEIKHANDTRSCNNGLNKGCRDIDGEIRQKRGDALIKTLRKTHGDDFASDVRGDARFGTATVGNAFQDAEA
jgi:hypothetical protein